MAIEWGCKNRIWTSSKGWSIL